MESAAKICIILGFEQSFLLDEELRFRVAEIVYLLDIALSSGVPGSPSRKWSSCPEVKRGC
ncbi:hypothetical protein AB0E81_38940 [Streptomyces sp. NPDC033538]|uniref:hypothetical protein n=1 Tax=Streptomyces sp. NPDC033538 TaxID=3155367 RepID=UPI0033BFEBE8